MVDEYHGERQQKSESLMIAALVLHWWYAPARRRGVRHRATKARATGNDQWDRLFSLIFFSRHRLSVIKLRANVVLIKH
jgi:hypothetical protein